MPATYYCYTCLKKAHKKAKMRGTHCPICGVEWRKCINARARAQTVTRLARHRGIEPKAKKSAYQKYLQSPIWKEIRARVLERDNHTCKDCGGPANQVHHESYAIEVKSGHDDSKLVSLCRPCHKLRHPEKQKRRKNPASGI